MIDDEPVWDYFRQGLRDSAAKSAHLGRTGHGPLPRAC
jgi:hypothetical protein